MIVTGEMLQTELEKGELNGFIIRTMLNRFVHCLFIIPLSFKNRVNE